MKKINIPAIDMGGLHMKYTKLRTIFTILLTISLLFAIGLTAYADLDDDTGGGGTTGAEAGTWNDTMQGYRFSIVSIPDKNY
jgi:hypothetical protein